MAAVLRYGAETLGEHIKTLCFYADPRSADLPMVRNPVPVAVILISYLYFVKSLGPWLMKNREPFELRTVMLIYNAVQVVWCAYLTRECIRLAWWGKYSYICEPLSKTMNPEDYEVAFTVWLYFFLKVVDLLDTVFMVMRKSYRQISFLHVYHHAGMVFCIWIGVKVFPGGHHTLLGFINCVVHCALYGYYFVSLYDPRAKVSWWKKYITLVQIVQFGINLIHEFIPILMPTCDVDKRISAVLVIQNLFMLILFSDFYIKCYVRRRPSIHKKET